MNGHWYFRARVQNRLYATALDDPPVGDKKDRWPGEAPSVAPFHDPFPSWKAFWGEAPATPEPPPWQPSDNFVKRLRRSASLPGVPKHVVQASEDLAGRDDPGR